MYHAKGKIFRIFLLACGLCASGCSMFTPPVERRIERNQATFDAYPLEVRENLRLGQIQLGYDKEMVSISLGPPDRRYLRLDSEGKVVIWVYLGKNVRSRHHRATVDLPMLDHNGNRITRREELDLDLDDHQEFDRRRIHFVDDKVVALEQTMD